MEHGTGATNISGGSAGPAELIVATFNVSLTRSAPGALSADLAGPGDAQATAVAAIIQGIAPDILFLNEVDFDADGQAVAGFQRNYLEVAQTPDATGLSYAYVWNAPVNTGIPSGYDLDGDGVTGTLQPDGTISDPQDAYGYGQFPGQYGMVLLSRYPIVVDQVRTFQLFSWQDQPNALLPVEAYGAAAATLRLSSKSHWDVPIQVGGETLHILAAHPTPPVFDDPYLDQNGRRNHDEIRFWADYVSGGEQAAYITDDNGVQGGLPEGARFVIVGDYNADPVDGASRDGAIRQLTTHDLVAGGPTPASAGGTAAALRQGGENRRHRGEPTFDTADFYDFGRNAPGNLRVDYVLPSKAGLAVTAVGLFWPAPGEPGFALVGPGRPVISSDHRLVYMGLRLVPIGKTLDRSGLAPLDPSPAGCPGLGSPVLAGAEITLAILLVAGWRLLRSAP